MRMYARSWGSNDDTEVIHTLADCDESICDEQWVTNCTPVGLCCSDVPIRCLIDPYCVTHPSGCPGEARWYEPTNCYLCYQYSYEYRDGTGWYCTETPPGWYECGNICGHEHGWSECRNVSCGNASC